MSSPAVTAEDLTVVYGDKAALDGLNLSIAPGVIHAILGPNGAGKTTFIRVATTLLTPTSGSIHVLGRNVVTDAAAVRDLIGVAGQYATIDEVLTGEENLLLTGTLYGLPANERRARAGDLLSRFDLTDAARRPARTYSGGMRRRLDLAASLMGNPEVLFLDEICAFPPAALGAAPVNTISSSASNAALPSAQTRAGGSLHARVVPSHHSRRAFLPLRACACPPSHHSRRAPRPPASFGVRLPVCGGRARTRCESSSSGCSR